MVHKINLFIERIYDIPFFCFCQLLFSIFLIRSTSPKKTKEKGRFFRIVLSLCRRWPIFPGRLQPSIVGVNELNYCVRNGNRCTLITINTHFRSTTSLQQIYYIISPVLCQVKFLVTRGRIELPFAAWEAAVLTAWPTGRMTYFRKSMVHHRGLEPRTHWLRVSCSTNWANGAYFILHPENWTISLLASSTFRVYLIH